MKKKLILSIILLLIYNTPKNSNKFNLPNNSYNLNKSYELPINKNNIYGTVQIWYWE